MKATPAQLSGLTALLRRSGATVECKVEGGSMGNVVPDGATVRIRCDGLASATEGTVVAIVIAGELSVHRLVHRGRSKRARGWLVTHGDANLTCDAPLKETDVVGRVEAVRLSEAGDWLPIGEAARHAWGREALTGGVNRVVCALLELDPRAAQWAKGLVVLVMAPGVWLRPYGPGQVRTASIAHRPKR
jgi:hypothetical protein